MAEPFSLAAGVITVIEATAKVIQTCKHLIETARDAPKDLCHIFIEISSLKATLESLHYLSVADCEFSDAVRGLVEIDGAIHGCRDTVEMLAAELDGLGISNSSQTSTGKRQKLKGSLRWCLKESKARKLLEDAVQHKSTISLALLGEVALDIKDLKRNIGKLRDDVSDTKRRDVCAWLEYINPTGYHNNTLKLREEHTCKWIQREPKWKDWLAGTQRFFWIHGIPGAGKTILASYIIEQTEAFCKNRQSKNVCLYYYCSYSHTTKDDTSGFLGWIVSQLCRKAATIPEHLLDLHNMSKEPRMEQLQEALGALLQRMDEVYIVLDGVDECKQRENLLKLIRTLMTDSAFTKIQLFATSRNYVDIEQALNPISASISMTNSLVNEDIRTYVNSELQTNPKVAHWPPELMTDVQETLVEGAKGMWVRNITGTIKPQLIKSRFRWAACQLYILPRKKTLADVRETLRTLPKTLSDTYERILLEIPEEEWPGVRTTLLWICVHAKLPFKMDLPVDALILALYPDGNLLEQTSPSNSTHIQELCGCLTRTSAFHFEGINYVPSEFDVISLAHYTVREFLYSKRIVQSKVRYFAMSEETSICEFLKLNLERYVEHKLKLPQFDCGDVTTISRGYCREVAQLAPYFWDELIISDEDIYNLQVDTFHSSEHMTYHTSKTEFVDDYSIISESYGWKMEQAQGCPMIKDALAYLTMILRDSSAFGRMAAKFLQSHDITTLMITPVTVQYKYRGQYYGSVEFEGILLEVLMFLSTRDIDICMKNIFEPAARAQSDVLFLSCISSHHLFGDGVDEYGFPSEGLDQESLHCHLHDLFRGDIFDCPLGLFLRHGNNPNSTDLPITPLQMAIYRWDLQATKLLLEHSAQVNAIGNRAAKTFPHLKYDPCWARCSPLHIIRNLVHGLEGLGEDYPSSTEIQPDRPIIERVLLEYGAEDFVMDVLGNRVDRGGTEPIILTEDHWGPDRQRWYTTDHSQGRTPGSGLREDPVQL
jgi:hypothetical protein